MLRDESMAGVISTRRAWIHSTRGTQSRGHLEEDEDEDEEDDIGTTSSQSRVSNRVIPLATLHINSSMAVSRPIARTTFGVWPRKITPSDSMHCAVRAGINIYGEGLRVEGGSDRGG
jgi:hypothetical protein